MKSGYHPPKWVNTKIFQFISAQTSLEPTLEPAVGLSRYRFWSFFAALVSVHVNDVGTCFRPVSCRCVRPASDVGSEASSCVHCVALKLFSLKFSLWTFERCRSDLRWNKQTFLKLLINQVNFCLWRNVWILCLKVLLKVFFSVFRHLNVLSFLQLNKHKVWSNWFKYSKSSPSVCWDTKMEMDKVSIETVLNASGFSTNSNN